MRPRALGRTAILPALVAGSGALLSVGCVANEHPLADNGSAQFVFDAQPLYAADVLDDNGQPVLPRQEPFEKVVQLFLTAGDAPDHGAYVDVQVTPPNALAVLPIDETCKQLPGAFRCRAEDDGFATFVVRSVSDWSGEARLSLVGRSNTNEQAFITVLPAGLPEGALNFSLIMEGNDVVQRSFASLECILTPVPDQTFDKWPPGNTRVREAEVRATPPPATPGVIKHAPVIVQSLHPEVFVTRDPSCGDQTRSSRLRIQLDELGRSPHFYFCFSDIGGSNVQLGAVSGAQSDQLTIARVEPEARLLRVVTIPGREQITAGQIAVEAVEISAFNANLEKISFTVDVKSSDPAVLAVESPTAELPLEGQTVRLRVDALAPGSATIALTPELFDQPRCLSAPITVVAP